MGYEFILPHIPHGMRGPEKKLPAYRTFQYICRVLHTGMQWQELEIKLNEKEEAEIHYTTLWRTFNAWTEHNVFSLFFEYSVKALMLADKLDMSILHGDLLIACFKKIITLIIKLLPTIIIPLIH